MRNPMQSLPRHRMTSRCCKTPRHSDPPVSLPAHIRQTRLAQASRQDPLIRNKRGEISYLNSICSAKWGESSLAFAPGNLRFPIPRESTRPPLGRMASNSGKPFALVSLRLEAYAGNLLLWVSELSSPKLPFVREHSCRKGEGRRLCRHSLASDVE